MVIALGFAQYTLSVGDVSVSQAFEDTADFSSGDQLTSNRCVARDTPGLRWATLSRNLASSQCQTNNPFRIAGNPWVHDKPNLKPKLLNGILFLSPNPVKLFVVATETQVLLHQARLIMNCAVKTEK